MTMQTHTFNKSNAIHKINPTSEQYIRTRKLGVRTLENQTQTLTIISGCAWVTVYGHDFILKSGDEIQLESGIDNPVISALGQGQLVYEIR